MSRINATISLDASHRVIALALVLVFSGGHLVVGQAVAWALMLVERSQTMSVADAVNSTFSGDAPCALCDQVKEVARDTQLPQAPERSNDNRTRGGMVLAEALPPLGSAPPRPQLFGDELRNFRDADGLPVWLMDRSIDMPPWV